MSEHKYTVLWIRKNPKKFEIDCKDGCNYYGNRGQGEREEINGLQMWPNFQLNINPFVSKSGDISQINQVQLQTNVGKMLWLLKIWGEEEKRGTEHYTTKLTHNKKQHLKSKSCTGALPYHITAHYPPQKNPNIANSKASYKQPLRMPKNMKTPTSTFY